VAVYINGTVPTGIEEIAKSQQPSPNTQYYDLQGRKVNKTARLGIYITNGQKIIVK